MKQFKFGRGLQLLLIAVLLITLNAGSAAANSAGEASWRTKVDAAILTDVRQGGEAEFLISMHDQADLHAAESLSDKGQKGAYVYQTLSEHARRTQAPVIAELQRLGLDYQSYWITNVIWVRAGQAAIAELASRPDVARLYANPAVRLQLPEPEQSTAGPALDAANAPNTISWNLLLVKADAVWALGDRGQGVVIGGQDTGYQWDHPALINQYRGWNGTTADHNYNWHDAIHSNLGSNPCGINSPEPCDDYGHGTHTMGIMVGDDGADHQVGMAPEAKWIGCRNMDAGVGSPQTYIECYQWFTAPTDLNGNDPDPNLAPDIINNSWACPVSEGCTEPDVLLAAVQNVRAAGILTVHSAGNSGSSCSSVNTPAAIYDESLTVGNTTSADVIAGSSSRGPVLVDGSNRLKPDISAPGSSINSSYPPDNYQYLSGTSMAAPHVAGLAALLISARPDLAGRVDQLEEIITHSAVPLTTSEECGGIPGSSIPNNTYGWGRIDALAAYYDLKLAATLGLSSPTIEPTGVLTYTYQVTNLDPSLPATQVVLTSTLPGDSDLIFSSQPYTLTGDLLEWTAPNLNPLATFEVHLAVQVQPGAGDTLVSHYGATSSELQPDALHYGPVEVPVVQRNLLIDKHTAANMIQPGGLLTYTLTVTNPNPTLAENSLILTDTLPSETSFVSASEPYIFDGQIVTWELSMLPAGGSWQALLETRANPGSSRMVSNAAYGVASQAVASQHGPPVNVPVLASIIYFPSVHVNGPLH
jgi:serine protease AprX